MQISARNVLKGTVSKVEDGAVNSEVTIRLADGVEIVSIITKHSVERLKLKQGDVAHAIIKSSDVIIARD